MLHHLECITHMGPQYGEENNIQIIIKLDSGVGEGSVCKVLSIQA